MPFTNLAAIHMASSDKHLTIRESPYPYPTPGPDQLIVRTRAVAVNFVNLAKFRLGSAMFNFLKYPLIMGDDLAGVVEAVGSGGTAAARFKPGDRVVALAAGGDPKVARSEENAFQTYVLVRANICARLPDGVSFEQAATLPLTLSTAACGMYIQDYLALPAPAPGKPVPNGRALLVWGGSTGVGLQAVQMAVASGFEVVSTASPRNFELVRRAGAAAVFEYRSKTAVKDVVAWFAGKDCAGAMAIGNGSLGKCLSVVGAAKSTGRKFVAQASVVTPDWVPPTGLALVKFLGQLMWFGVSMTVKSAVLGVPRKFIWGSDLLHNEVGDMVWRDYVEKALEDGSFKMLHEPVVVGTGLDKIEEAMNVLAEGVSAKKVVVSL